ncbi:MAG: HDOD domain-containing protein [Planctomycetes bacterium]|nr:HDOD domain-containing protein [Planctomycetota bacterium]
MSQLVQVMRSLRTMPPLPGVAQRVLQIVRDPDYSIDTLVSVVRTDPALTTRILKLCNSSLYGLSQEIASVGDAVAYLGTRNLVKLVLISCTSSYFKRVGVNGYVDPAELWKHTLCCASVCQFLAERSGYEQPATAFTTGILHNVGKVALAQVVDDVIVDVPALLAGDPGLGYLEIERKVVGLDHANAGGIVTESWSLPTELRRAVRNHHDPALIRGDGDLTALLHVADQMVLGMGIGAPFAGLTWTIDPTALDKLHLTDADLEGARTHVTEELVRSAELLNLDTLDGR